MKGAKSAAESRVPPKSWPILPHFRQQAVVDLSHEQIYVHFKFT
jgi:hypothetical protein